MGVCGCAECGMCVFDLYEAQKKEERKGQSKAHFLDQTRNFKAIHSASETQGVMGGGASAIMYAAI